VHWVLHDIDASLSITPLAIDRLRRHHWPGNFRELRSVLTRALLAQEGAAPGLVLDVADIEPLLPSQAAPAGEGQPSSRLQRSVADMVRAEFERCGKSVSRTSRNLQISRTTVYRHLRG
jgi:sigma-54 dependent transcriptional regulator, acetoin dehydrogenase operon transcriptional activator AcoR